MAKKENDEGLKERERIMAEEKTRAFPLTEDEIKKIERRRTYLISPVSNDPVVFFSCDVVIGRKYLVKIKK